MDKKHKRANKELTKAVQAAQVETAALKAENLQTKTKTQREIARALRARLGGGFTDNRDRGRQSTLG